MSNGENIKLQPKPNSLRKLKTKLFELFNVKASKSKFTLNKFSTF